VRLGKESRVLLQAVDCITSSDKIQDTHDAYVTLASNIDKIDVFR
jgi:hypothetical protein